MATTLNDSPSSAPAVQQQPKQSWWRTLADSYFFRKILKAIFTIWVVTTIIFFLVRMLPGNPIEQYVNQLVVNQNMEYKQAMAQAAALFSIDLDEPMWKQYLNYLSDLLHGDLGNSIVSPGTSVNSIINKFLPWTLFSVGLGLIISFMLGILLGLTMAFRRDRALDHGLTIFASLVSSVPNYLIGIILLVWLGVQWKVISIAHMRGSLSPGVQPAVSLAFISDVLYHAFLPILTYVLTSIGGWMLAMKGSTVGTLGEDYVTVARARGLTDWRITTAYVGRNASLPLFTSLTIAIGFVVGGSFLIEQIFQYQGIGFALGAAINSRDYPVMQGIFLVITITVILANLFADILYGSLDPRIKRQ
jgi:peptide/nickel transport system permease protein